MYKIQYAQKIAPGETKIFYEKHPNFFYSRQSKTAFLEVLEKFLVKPLNKNSFYCLL